MNHDIARRWITANFVAMLVVGVLGLCGYWVRAALAIDSADASFAARASYIAIETAFTMIAFAVYARLTGAVLRLIVPALPQRNWLAVHLAIGLVNGVILGLLLSEPASSEPTDWSDTGLVVFLGVVVAVAGAVVGAVIGGLQALVLRRVAHGIRAWVSISAAATSVMLLIAVAVFPFLPAEPTFAVEVVSTCVLVIAGVVAAFIMLPALRRLHPRTI